MKDILQDIVSHTHALGFLSLIKVTNNTDTFIDSMTDDRKVVLHAKTHAKVKEFSSTFGMGNLDKLNLHLKNPEYRQKEKIYIVEGTRDGETVPTHLHFENEHGDFQNDYRFMNKTIIEEKLKNAVFKGATWDVTVYPSVASIARFKLMSAAHSEETVFTVLTKDNNLVFSFGDTSSHAGEFVFEHDIEGSLKRQWSWPINEVQSILNLNGHLTMSISDQGAMKISVDSGLAQYDYICPAQSK
tara:strand:- start:725 stop:1453 length:729 start_codon:yes stop_codon:yes gene_type:complete